MKTLLPLIFFGLILLPCAMANTPENIEKVKEFAAKNSVQISIDKESKANRAGKQMIVSLNFGFELDQAASGVTFGYYLKPNKLVTLGFSRLRSDRMFMTEIRSRVAKVSYKVFTGNSFYVDSGLFYIDTEYEQTDFFGTPETTNIRTTSNFKRLGAQVRIGNQWQWENFTLGVDWIGFGTDVIDIEDTGFKPDVTELNGTYVTLLNLKLGMSF